MSPAPENDSATAGEEIPKVDLTETHGQDVGDNPGHGSGDDHHHQQTDQGAGEKKPSVLIEATAAKKKSRKRGKNNKNKPTGFEEFFCDPPMTPDEYEQEKTVIYPPSRPFVDRIEECIQRFRARRRMGNDRDLYFSKYLALGGVDSTTRQFQSTRKLNAEDLEGLSKAEVREITADDAVQRSAGKQDRRWYHPEHPEHWEVDFAGVAAGYCSVELSQYAILAESQYRAAVETIFNFLKYVDSHEVCPEYAEDVKKAQKICETALEEMPTVVSVSGQLPGRFNAAAAHLFRAREQEASAFIDDFGSWEMGETEKPLDDATARIIFGSTVAILLDKKLGESLVGSDAAVAETDEGLFEIVGVSLADDVAKAKYQATRHHLDKAMGLKVETCGSLTFRPTTVLDGWDNSMNDGISFTGEQTVILEEKLLKQLKVGQTVVMTVCTMNVEGFKFIKSVSELRPTFYTFLPQSLMVRFKEPVPDNRPAPSIHNPNLQEEILADIPQDDEYEMDDKVTEEDL